MKNSTPYTIPQATTRPVQLEHARASKLFAEWQQRGPETLSGLAVPKLRLVVAPPQSVVMASAAS